MCIFKILKTTVKFFFLGLFHESQLLQPRIKIFPHNLAYPGGDQSIKLFFSIQKVKKKKICYCFSWHFHYNYCIWASFHVSANICIFLYISYHILCLFSMGYLFSSLIYKTSLLNKCLLHVCMCQMMSWH